MRNDICGRPLHRTRGRKVGIAPSAAQIACGKPQENARTARMKPFPLKSWAEYLLHYIATDAIGHAANRDVLQYGVHAKVHVATLISLGMAMPGSIGCKSQPSERATPTLTNDDAASARCVRSPEFKNSIDLAEASGASYVTSAGDPPYVLVIGDSGTNGAFLELDPTSGSVLTAGRLPLDPDASDDLEGVSVRQGIVYAITSAGWVRHWRKNNGNYELVQSSYPIADPSSRWVCRAQRTNCARNYEGLCLRPGPVPAGECVGFAASKTDGQLYCLRMTATSQKLVISPEHSVGNVNRRTLTGCDFSPEGDRLWLGTNLLGGSFVYEVERWRSPKSASVKAVGAFGAGFPEAMALGPRAHFYRFSDTGASPSLADLFICE